MAPLIFITTIITHLFGGSAGREGTAVQIGTSIADRFSVWLNLNKEARQIILLLGISAGFSAVFGTPLTGAIFAIELVLIKKIAYKAVIPSILVAYLAHYVCLDVGATHTHYTIPEIPEISFINLFWTIIAGSFFGLASVLFSKSQQFWSTKFNTYINYAPLRPFIGGIIIAGSVWLMGTTKYIGLGVPTIVEAFSSQLGQQDFILKLLLTTFTLGAGFKGGEVTPLFFIGATLGNTLYGFIPLPMGLLAGMGFVAIFSGSTKTPIACSIMGFELFGLACYPYVLLACVIAYLTSGNKGIYASQITPTNKYTNLFLKKEKTTEN